MPRCVYSVLRYVPDRALGECINIGLIVGGDDDWQYVEISPLKRLRWFHRASADMAHESVQEIVQDVTSLERLTWWHTHAYAGIVAVSQPMPISAASTAEAAAFIRDVFVKEAA